MKISIQPRTTMALTGSALVLSALLATPAAHATIIMNGSNNCPDPAFKACYIGVNGAGTASIPSGSSESYSFVGLGVQSNELGAVTFPPNTPASGGTPTGSLTLLSGSTLDIVGTVNPARPVDVSLIVGLGNGSTGTLFVNGGTVNTPVMLIGEQDTRTSQGTATVAYGGQIVASLDSTTANAPVPGMSAISIGRGAGSTGSLNIDGIGSSVSTTLASVSVGRAGMGTLQVVNGASFSSAGSIYASAADPAGSSSITVTGVGSVLNVGAGGNVLVGIASTGSGLNLGYDPTSTAHGTSTLDVTDGAQLHGNVVVGAGGTVKGTGSIYGNVTNDGGTTSPGNSPGTLHINGNYVMNGGVYLVEVAGTGAGMTDLLDIAGTANLSNATILFSFIDGFAPSAGFSFDFLDAAQGVTTSNLTFQTQGLLPGFTFTTGVSNGLFAFTALTDGLAVPEPETLPLVFLGLLGAVAVTRRNRRTTR